ncbi:N2227-like protein [Nitzschia inconspicua]|uniref:N2227-like protein n=1 Tax=Nitzschia inconspicua TaxID=303405 RepID=A0A9K3L6Q2_9STRA|nr:N2227-like protein [Nitzschia inconspicua]
MDRGINHHHDHESHNNQNDCRTTGGNNNHVVEQQHFENVCEAYRQYGPFAMAQWTSRIFRLHSLSDSQRQLLPPELRPEESNTNNNTDRASEYRDALIRNQFCLDCILRHAGQPHSQEQQQRLSTEKATVSEEQVSKVSSVLKSLARDWSAEGRQERDAAYGPILDLVKKYLPLQSVKKSANPINICVPGSGVGRLALELRAAGYSVQGNDFSLYMLLASDFVLNNGGMCTPDRPIVISPWLLESRNHHSYKDELRTVSIPDVDPMELLQTTTSTPVEPPPDFSMAAGDFCAIYSHDNQANQWDCVASCFFLDACPNVIETLQVIYNMLRPGGILINLGPLLYHWSGPMLRPDDGTWQRYRERHSHLDDRYMTSIDLAFDDVKQIMKNIGFEILEENAGMECYYTADMHSMMRTRYQCTQLRSFSTSMLANEWTLFVRTRCEDEPQKATTPSSWGRRSTQGMQHVSI